MTNEELRKKVAPVIVRKKDKLEPKPRPAAATVAIESLSDNPELKRYLLREIFHLQ